MSESGMPWSVLNMGSEMLYILEQRLQAQSISEDKAVRVLQDVIGTMFSDKFVGELFKPQKMYSASATRAVFDQLAHSSIMRLNSTSMDKLYDLMTMAVKHQMMLTPSPFDLPAVCSNHIDTLKKLNLDTESKKLIDRAHTQLTHLYSTCSYVDFFLLKQALARFYQDKRIKVSLFLQEGLQLADGNIVVSCRGPVPVNVEIPGRVTYFDNGKVVRTENIKLSNAEGLRERSSDDRCELGLNLYAKDKRRKAREAALTGSIGDSTNITANKRSDRGREEYDEMLDENDKKGARSELNALASLIARPALQDKDSWNIDQLFPGLNDGTAKDDNDDMLVFDAEDRDTRLCSLENRMGDLDVKGVGREDDLLDLMDRAA